MDKSIAVKIKSAGYNFNWGVDKKEEEEDKKKTKSKKGKKGKKDDNYELL